MTQKALQKGTDKPPRHDLFYETAPDTSCIDPVSMLEMRALVASGTVLPTFRVWREGMVDWAALQDRPSLVDCLPPRQDLFYETAPDTPCIDPVSMQEMRALVASSTVLPTSRVWREGMADWAELQDRPSLVECLHDPS